MNKYLATILFEWTDEMNELLSEHSAFINSLIEDLVLEHYAVSMEVQTAWATINADTKEEVEQILSVSPLYKYWTLEIRELIVWDGLSYRLPALQLN